MGDNVHLGDRNGVRTPMQWSADRNAGFSRAEPERLYSPVIADAVYGYQAVNVEAQRRAGASLFSWVKTLIAARKSSRVFGRGTFRVLDSANTAVLAHLREHETDAVLAVHNLAAVAQAVELDLRAFRGVEPVEMIGGARFPPVTDRPYTLTLGPHGFFWLRLAQRPRGPDTYGIEGLTI
jgi:maltose alpha-D-glucosyltransferase/alpha-amylase